MSSTNRAKVRRVTEAMVQMVKLDSALLKAAFRDEESKSPWGLTCRKRKLLRSFNGEWQMP